MTRYKIFTAFLICLCITACATFGGKQELSPKQQAVVWTSLYNQQYKDANAAVMGSFIHQYPKEKKDFIMKKLEILAELKPLLDDYETIAWSGGTPNEKMVMTINYLIYKLTDTIVGGM